MDKISPSLFQVIIKLSQLNDHKIKLAQILRMPELRNDTDISALYYLTEILIKDACFIVSFDCTESNCLECHLFFLIMSKG